VKMEEIVRKWRACRPRGQLQMRHRMSTGVSPSSAAEPMSVLRVTRIMTSSGKERGSCLGREIKRRWDEGIQLIFRVSGDITIVGDGGELGRQLDRLVCVG